MSISNTLNAPAAAPIRVLLVDDNFPYRMFLRALLEQEPDMVVVGESGNGARAVQQARELVPDVVLMDLDMPGLDGLSAARKLRELASRVIILTALTPEQVEIGYSESTTQGIHPLIYQLIYKDKRQAVDWNARLLDGIRQAGLPERPIGEALPVPVRAPEPTHTPAAAVREVRAVLIGASTGGPQAVASLLRALPDPLTVPVLIVIHVAENFAESMAGWLGSESGKTVRRARHGERLTDAVGACLLAPEGVHMSVSRGRIVLTEGDSMHGVCPAVDPLFASAADDYGAQVVAALLTGMGCDGAAGLLALRQRGAVTIAQDEATCVVFGMPGQAILLGAAERVLPLPHIAAAIRSLLPSVRA